MSLEQQIRIHRAAYKDELHIERLVQRQPPTTLDLNTGVLHQEPAAAIGMTISGRLLKYVSHPEGYGGEFPWSKGLYGLRWWCRKNHEFHRAADRPYWRGSLCHQLVIFTVIRGWSVQNAAEILRYDDPEPVLRLALEYIEQRMDAEREKAEKRVREDAGKFTIYDQAPVHHAVPGMHMADCPQCRRNAA